VYDTIGTLLYLAVPLVLVFLGLVIGSGVESIHFRRLALREHALSGITASDLKRIPANWDVSDPVLVTGEVVIATDYFKVFVGTLRGLLGGRIRAYETLMERARREAVVRMLEQAYEAGANVVWNVRLETTMLEGKQSGKSSGIEVLAYGTAMKARGQQPSG
jgi:uncharacterized protein YbjQ (UPF0145 family)